LARLAVDEISSTQKSIKLRWFCGLVEKIALDELPLLDLHGTRVTLTDHFQEHLLLIFLRHLA